MPYATTWEESGVLWTFRGQVTGDELLRANQEVSRDPRFRGLTYQIVDLTNVERFDVTEDDMALVALQDRAATASSPGIRVAIAAADEMIKDLSAFYDAVMVGSTWHQRIFDSIGEAREWLTQSDDGA
jgi:hypothetical protein